MDLAYLETVYSQLDIQLQSVLTNPPPDGKEVIRHTNAIEVLAARNLMQQLIHAEKRIAAVPPGSTGPIL